MTSPRMFEKEIKKEKKLVKYPPINIEKENPKRPSFIEPLPNKSPQKKR